MSAPATTGSTTSTAAVPATEQTAPATVAAPPTAPATDVKYVAPAKKQKSFAPREPTASSAGPKNPGLSMMLSGVSDLPFFGIKHNDISYVVPDTTQLFYVLSIMDTQMVRTKRFTDANPDWHPFVSQLYIAVLFYYQVLKNQSHGGMITNDQRLFVEFLDSQFKAEHLKIPGPIAIFFQSLAANAGPNENFGNLVFGIPNAHDINCTSFLWQDKVHTILPNVIFILDQFMRLISLISPVNSGPVQANASHTDTVYTTIFGAPASKDEATRFAMLTPSARSDFQTTVGLLNGLATSSNVWRNTLPFANDGDSQYVISDDDDTLDLDQVFGFRGIGNHADRPYGWFAQVIRVMQPYSDFFKDTVSLGSVTTTGTGISYVRTKYVATRQNKNILVHAVTTRKVRYQTGSTLRYDIPEFTGITTIHLHSEEFLDLVTEQAGILTQLNSDWTDINKDVTDTSNPDFKSTHVGPIFSIPDSRRTSQYNVSNTIAPLISGYYHTPSALRFE
ncbi:putative coat protein [Amasya cherry disease-associated mycovirus]|uniref:Putative coat protein n=1 Tax=Amasya cherry disease-associated mycovirus TaxID=284689 RepID=Q65A76_9VIRU|nr:putative coat protein [Amasya cherry disease-associated mycovirus]CAG77603.1 putative coat protein [Amasya cherry disease-associated mycovirus]